MSDQSKTSMAVSRRGLLGVFGGGALAVAGATLTPKSAQATPDKAAELAKKLSGKMPAGGDARVSLKLPEIAENGNTVPVTVKVESPMTAADHVKKIHIISEGNPNPGVCSFTLSAECGKAEVATRIRMAKTQNIVAVAEMSDGSVISNKKETKVTIGGCGG
ncbi:thiosulfate oxidation carrier protein SoxY [Magnetospira sp. QH-2]|uniref:thiosulfate oxidation carrier protein SoxY n=1 Tax=Magnetospira sp. (strain QH-2) TaxID=1288970 RepID=UPI0003E81A52|nr:thiosulfate oxidation carrier protein SoxY [Magnetospira sp. QH-2]CCQ73760.1 Sulfur oxidation protein (soxY) [Magnetospira sp. QH-2]